MERTTPELSVCALDLAWRCGERPGEGLKCQGPGVMSLDGSHDSGGHLRSAHRALLLKHRRIVEDAGLRRSSDSQLLQMADGCAHAAFQSVQNKASLDEKFRRQYETTLSRLIARPFGVEDGRCIRGLDYQGDATGCPSERIAHRP